MKRILAYALTLVMILANLPSCTAPESEETQAVTESEETQKIPESKETQKVPESKETDKVMEGKETQSVPKTADQTDTESGSTVTLFQYVLHDSRAAAKTVSRADLAGRIVDALKTMKETGEIVEKISDDEVPEHGGFIPYRLPVESGTMWIKAGGLLYRLTPGLNQICRVENHLSEGYVLEMSDAFKTDVYNAWYYEPYNYYKGIYRGDDGTLELDHVYILASTVELNVKDIRVEKKYDPQNTITVELTSTVDQTVSVRLECQQSPDNRSWGDGKKVDLQKGTAETVELSFGGWPNFGYMIYIYADNTKAAIRIEP